MDKLARGQYSTPWAKKKKYKKIYYHTIIWICPSVCSLYIREELYNNSYIIIFLLFFCLGSRVLSMGR